MRLFKFFALAFACMAAVNSCNKPVIGPEGDPFIEVDKLQIEAPYQGVETSVNINSNTKWTLTRTDEGGNPIEWVKFDKLSYNGSIELGVKVEENPTQEERSALITFEADGEKAFLEVTQAANPNEKVEPEIPDTPVLPDDPEQPTDGKKVLRFDFSGSAQSGWPTASDQGTSDLYLNRTLIYNLYGVDYQFVFRCIPSATEAKSFWAESGYLAIEKYRYLELPRIEGFVVESVDCEVGKKIDGIGYITSEVTTATSVTPSEDSEPQSWNVDAGTVLKFNVNSTDSSKPYYLYSGKPNGLRVSYIEITYAPESDVPADPTPDPIPDPTPDPTPDPAVTLELEFDFATPAQDGWPTAQGDAASNMNKTVTYTLNGVPYNFILLEAPGSKGEKLFWQSGEYFALAAQYRYLGLPILDGYVLTTVDCTVGKQVATTAAYVTSEIGGITADTHPGTDTAAQSWNKEVGTVILYEVNATDSSKQYYLYCKSKGTYMSNLKLTYTKL